MFNANDSANYVSMCFEIHSISESLLCVRLGLPVLARDGCVDTNILKSLQTFADDNFGNLFDCKSRPVS